MKELSPAMIRRVLVTTGFDYCDELFWRETDGVLKMYAQCSDFFGWGIADVEPIECAADVRLLELCLKDLREATGEQYPLWLTELYAARRRKQRPARWFLSPETPYFLGDKFLPLFTADDLKEPLE